MMQSVGLGDLVTHTLSSYQAQILQLSKSRRTTQIYRKLLTQGLGRNKNAARQWAQSLELQLLKKMTSSLSKPQSLSLLNRQQSHLS